MPKKYFCLLLLCKKSSEKSHDMTKLSDNYNSKGNPVWHCLYYRVSTHENIHAIQYYRNFFINVISPDHRLLHSRLHIEVCLKKRRIGWFCFDAFLFLHSYVDDVRASTFGPRHRLGLRFWAGVLQHPQIWNSKFKIHISFSSSSPI